MAATGSVLGIDIGGSGIKGNLVDTATGELLGDRHKILTPKPATPEAVGDVVAALREHFDHDGPMGCAFPAVVQNGITQTAANVDRSWIGANAVEIFSERCGVPVSVVNDADAAGLAEARFGAGRGRSGVVLVLTFGTGIGSALVVDGHLVPNTELGHLQFLGYEAAEHYAAARVRDEEGLSWSQWAGRASEYLQHLARLFSPNLFVVGGGLSRKWHKYEAHLNAGGVEVVPAELQNQAGIVGAALAVPS